MSAEGDRARAPSTSCENSAAERAVLEELCRLDHLNLGSSGLARLAFIRLFQDKICSRVQALPLVRLILAANGHTVEQEEMELLCESIGATFL